MRFTQFILYLAAALSSHGYALASNVVVYGDSLSAGFGSDLRDPELWPSRLEVLLERRQSPARVSNRSINGNGLVWSTRCFGSPALDRLQADWKAVSADTVIVVMAGVNDAIQPNLPQGFSSCFDPAAFPSSRITDRLRALALQSAGHRILLATLPPFAASEFFSARAERVRQETNAWIRANWPCNDIVDLDAILGEPAHGTRLRRDFDSGDGLHPNERGADAIAAAVANLIAPSRNEGASLIEGGRPQWISYVASAQTDWTNRIIELGNGRIVSVGFLNRDDNAQAPDWNVFIETYDPEGRRTSSQSFGGPGVDAAWAAIGRADGSIAVGGIAAGGAGGDLDAALTIVRERETAETKRFGGAEDDRATDLLELADKSLLLIGQSNSSGAGGIDMFLVKTDPSGKELWRKTYGGPSDDRGFFGVAMPDGGAIVAGVTGPRGSYDLLLIRIAPDGSEIWRRVVAGDGNDATHGIARLRDGSVMLVGYGPSWGGRDNDVSVLRFADDGRLLSHQLIGGTGDDRVQFAAPDRSGGAWLTGYTKSFSEGWRMLIARVGQNGQVEPWLGAIGGPGQMNGSAVTVAAGGDLFLGGYTTIPSGGANPPDAFTMRLSPRAFDRRRDGIEVRTIEMTCKPISPIETRCTAIVPAA